MQFYYIGMRMQKVVDLITERLKKRHPFILIDLLAKKEDENIGKLFRAAEKTERKRIGVCGNPCGGTARRAVDRKAIRWIFMCMSCN